MTMTKTNETTDERIKRLAPDVAISDARRESLTIAHERGVSDAVFLKLATATRLRRDDTIVLPPQHLESLSRGRGWCRKGRGDGAEWGERTDNGYRVGPGKWTVGATDGFHRKRQDVWTVQHVAVNGETWTVAS